MLKTYKILTLTDHSGHSEENSIYALLKQMIQHPQCASVHIASRGNRINDDFFQTPKSNQLQAFKVDESFSFQNNDQQFSSTIQNIKVDTESYDIIFLRLPRPISDGFFSYLTKLFPHQKIINNPLGIQKTSSKQYLLNFPELCPPIQLCKNIDDIIKFSKAFPIVLKPLRNYGGKGIVKIDGNTVVDGQSKILLKDYLPSLEQELDNGGYLGMKYLKNVKAGDKRIIVVNGKILGASLRLPVEGSWLCNVAQGGRSVLAEADADEQHIIQTLNPSLLKEGIVMCGVDTLVDDSGKRILSEINTLSIGGFPQAEKQLGKPIIKQAIEGIFDYINKE